MTETETLNVTNFVFLKQIYIIPFCRRTGMEEAC